MGGIGARVGPERERTRSPGHPIRRKAITDEPGGVERYAVLGRWPPSELCLAKRSLFRRCASPICGTQLLPIRTSLSCSPAVFELMEKRGELPHSRGPP